MLMTFQNSDPRWST